MAAIRPEHIPLIPRYAELARLQAYYENTQYRGRPDFWTGEPYRGGHVAPLRERAPCIIYPLPKASVQQVVRFCFGEGRFPTLVVEPQQDDQFAPLSLSEEEAELLSTGLDDVIENGRIKPVMRTIMTRGLAERTAVVIGSVKRGRFVFDLPHAKDCNPTFRNDDPDDEVLELVWAYKYKRAVIENGVATEKEFWFRRDITAVAFLDYAPVEVIIGKTEDVDWPAPLATPHGFGFCPVRWIRNLKDTDQPGGIDGLSLYEDLFDEFDALNFALSQRHRGITFFGTPQPWETGVEGDDGPEADGRKAVPAYTSTSAGGMAGIVKGQAGSHGAMADRVRKLAPDRIWSYEGEQVRVGLLETTGKAFEVATLHVEDVRQRVLESMSVVLASIESFVKGGADMNAKFLVLAFAPLLTLVDELRDATWWGDGLRGVLSLALRMLSATGGKGVVMANAIKLAALVGRFEVQTTDGPVWMLPKISPLWGDAFTPSNAEVNEAVKSAAEAFAAKLIPLKPATTYIASYFKIDDIDAAVEELEEAAQEAAETEHANAVALTEAKRPPQVPPGTQPGATSPKPTSGPKGPKA